MSHRYEDLAERWLDVVTRSGSEWMARCPFHGEDNTPSLQFNVDKGLYVCFRCEDGGSAKTLVRRLGGSWTDPVVSTEYLRKSLDRLLLKQKHEEQGPQTFDEKYLLRFGGIPHEYWTDARGFDAATIKKWGLGYNPLNDRCTIAYRDVDSSLLGVIERRLDNEFPRYLYPKGFDRTGSLFGSWEVATSKGNIAILLEGSTDVIQVSRTQEGDGRTLAQWGNSISQRQVKLLRQIGVREVILFYDYDLGGWHAELQAREALEGFILRKVMWDQHVYCWHEKVCACDENHRYLDLAKCQFKVPCDCGRKHKMDPGKLKLSRISEMLTTPVLVGGKSSWRTAKSAQ
jgi:DNA primase